ncbi:MAG: Cys-tRNA(Pro) deacylase [Candidatus Thiodiazotropha taylori]|nr:Cys-tRNA(Pro) deacylase [Candidatus Thiodiazotropha taylori]
MTPAVKMAKQAGITYQTHSYQHDPQHDSYGMEAVEKLGLPAERVFKTLVVSIDGGGLAVGVLPVSAKLDLKALAKVLNVKKLAMADPRAVERSSGYVLGGVSPLGQKRKLPTVIDRSAAQSATIYVSAGKRGLEIELSPEDLANLLDATMAAITK